MLSPGDKAVVERDSALPGLRVVLDRELFVEELRRRLPPDVALHGARTTYVRYKPGTNCLVGFELQTGLGAVDVTAAAYRAAEEEKFRKHLRRAVAPSVLGAGAVAIEDSMVLVLLFPNDRRLPSLAKLIDARTRAHYLERLMPVHPRLWSGEVRKLAYKPMRRFVGQLVVDGVPRAVIRIHGKSGFDGAAATARTLHSSGPLHLPQTLGVSGGYRAIAKEWLPGRPLWSMLGAAPAAPAAGSTIDEDRTLRRVGAALAHLHAQRVSPGAMPKRLPAAEAERLRSAAEAVGSVCPALRGRALAVATRIGKRLAAVYPKRPRPIHGDFYADQVLLDLDSPDRVGVVDLDEATLGDPVSDVGNFIAHLLSHTLRGRLDPDRTGAFRTAFLEGYQAAQPSSKPLRARVIDLHTAAGLVLLAPHIFRRREPDWAGRTEALIERCEAMVGLGDGHRATAEPPITVTDPFDVPADPTMTFTRRALDPKRMRGELRRCLASLAGPGRQVRLCSIRVVRHKIGLRCLIEYQLDLEPIARGNGADTAAPSERERVVVIGKIRAKGTDETTFRVTESLSSGPFRPDSPDGYSVAPALGILPDLRIWFQRKVRGVPAAQLVARPGGVELVRRIAELSCKLHAHPVPTHRRHCMADELRILHQRLGAFAAAEPRLSGRVARLLALCDRVGNATAPPSQVRGIHRDFYADQVLVDEADAHRLYLLDLDLYCHGDPALDAGNFIAHLTEQALRTLGDPAALAEHERAMEDRFVELSGEAVRPAVRAYAALTLARHVYISSKIHDRRAFIDRLIDLAEERLARAAADLGAPPHRSLSVPAVTA